MLTYYIEKPTRTLRIAPTAEDLAHLRNTITIYNVTRLVKGPEKRPDRPWYRLFNGKKLIGHISDMKERESKTELKVEEKEDEEEDGDEVEGGGQGGII
jgi:hypothetical protein